LWSVDLEMFPVFASWSFSLFDSYLDFTSRFSLFFVGSIFPSPPFLPGFRLFRVPQAALQDCQKSRFLWPGGVFAGFSIKFVLMVVILEGPLAVLCSSDRLAPLGRAGCLWTSREVLGPPPIESSALLTFFVLVLPPPQLPQSDLLPPFPLYSTRGMDFPFPTQPLYGPPSQFPPPPCTFSHCRIIVSSFTSFLNSPYGNSSFPLFFVSAGIYGSWFPPPPPMVAVPLDDSFSRAPAFCRASGTYPEFPPDPFILSSGGDFRPPFVGYYALKGFRLVLMLSPPRHCLSAALVPLSRNLVFLPRFPLNIFLSTYRAHAIHDPYFLLALLSAAFFRP